MKLEQQVCSLELAKRIKELGVKQESLWWWFDVPNMKKNNKRIFATDFEPYISSARSSTHSTNKETQRTINQHTYSAFTVAEMGELLPNWHYLGKDGFGHYYCGLNDEAVENDHIKIPKDFYYEDIGELQQEDKLPANALAKMLIYLLENKLI